MKKILKKIQRKLERFLVEILPSPISRAIGFLYGFRISKKSYSQYGEDLILESYFQKIGLSDGVYVDIGGFHPTWLSNTYLLHKKGWSGFVVDVDRLKLKTFEILRDNRCKTFYGAVVAEKNTQTTTLIYKFKKLYSEIDTLSEEHAKKMKQEIGVDYYETSVPLISVAELFDSIGKCDFLNIDIEGIDEMILFGVNLEYVKPKVIVYEDNQNFGGSSVMADHLTKLGYQRLFISGGSIGWAIPISNNF